MSMPRNALFITLTTLAGGLISGMVGFGICKLVLAYKDRRDKKAVYKYMRMLIPTENNWLTTSDIAKNTRLSYSRVEDICGRHPEIIPITGMGSPVWGLLDISEEHSIPNQSDPK